MYRAPRVVSKRSAKTRDQRPRNWFERYLASLPCAPTYLGGRFKQDELVRPCGEATVATKPGQLSQDRHHGIVRTLLGEVFVIAAPEVRQHCPAAVDFEASTAHEQCVELPNRGIVLPAPGGKPLDPIISIVVGAARRG